MRGDVRTLPILPEQAARSVPPLHLPHGSTPLLNVLILNDEGGLDHFGRATRDGRQLTLLIFINFLQKSTDSLMPRSFLHSDVLTRVGTHRLLIAVLHLRFLPTRHLLAQPVASPVKPKAIIWRLRGRQPRGSYLGLRVAEGYGVQCGFLLPIRQR